MRRRRAGLDGATQRGWATLVEPGPRPTQRAPKRPTLCPWAQSPRAVHSRQPALRPWPFRRRLFGHAGGPAMNATVASSQGAASKSSCRASPACRERAVRLVEAAELVGGPLGCVHRCGGCSRPPWPRRTGHGRGRRRGNRAPRASSPRCGKGTRSSAAAATAWRVGESSMPTAR